MGLGITGAAPCLAGVFSVCFFLFVTIWVAPGNRARELRTRGPTVLTQDSQGRQMVALFTSSRGRQIPCIGQVAHDSMGFDAANNNSSDSDIPHFRCGQG